MKRLFITILCALLFGVLMPLQAQEPSFSTVTPEYTQVPPETVTAPIVVPETPEATDADTLGFWQITIHLINAGVALAIVYFLYSSVPAETRKELNKRVETELDEAEKKAKTTETPFDDLAVQAAKYGYRLVKAETEKPTVTVGSPAITFTTTGNLGLVHGGDDTTPEPVR